MIKHFRVPAMLGAFLLAAAPSYAGIIFSFTESGGNVYMTSSGVLDTTKLVAWTSAGWSGTGVYQETGTYDMMGTNSGGPLDTAFKFNLGTDVSAWASASGPFGASQFGWTIDAGSRSFATYVDDEGYVPGIALTTSDIVDGFWSPDHVWSITGATFASLQLLPGTYTVTDAETGEFITYHVGDAISPVPEPSTMLLMGAGFAAIGFRFRRKQ